jgi:elongation factor Ts
VEVSGVEEDNLAISTQMVKELREETGAGVLDCKKALEATNGDFSQAAAYLREKGLTVAAKKASREANEGLIEALVDGSGQLGAIVELNCETDFVARTDEFQVFAAAIVKQIAQEAELPALPELLELPFIDDQSVTVGERLTGLIAKLGENMVLRRFARLERDRDGLIEAYVHPGSRIGVLVDVSAGSEGVARSAVFGGLVHDLALQVAAAAPEYISTDDVPESIIRAKQDGYLADLAQENKPDHIKERVVSGKLEKWYVQTCLLRQPFVKDDGMTIDDLIAQKGRELGKTLAVERFVRYELETGE